MSTRHTEEPTFLIPAAVVGEVNAYLTRQNYGAVFNIPLVIGTPRELVTDSEPLVTHYGTSWRMQPRDKGIIKRFIDSRQGETIEKPWRQAIADRGATRDMDSHPFQLIIVVTAGQRNAIITRLTTRYPDADARFFKTGLSATGTAPIERYADWLYASSAFKPLLDQVINQLPRSEVFIGCRDGRIDAVKTLYGDPKYQGPNAATRAFARVWINHVWTREDMLGKLNLSVVT